MRTLSTTALLASPLLLAAAQPRDSVSLRLEAGHECTRTFALSQELALVEMSQLFDGQEQPGGDEMEREQSATLEFSVSDSVLAAEDGVAMRLSRSYDELAETRRTFFSHPMMSEPNEMEREAESELAERTVVFERDEDGEYSATFEGEDDDEDPLLQGLDADLDFSVLLPEGDVERGDSWEVDGDALRFLLRPGGSLKLVPDGADMDVMMQLEDHEFENELEYDGVIEVVYVGQREADGDSIAILELTVDVSNEVDLTEQMASMNEDGDLPEGAVMPEFDLAEESTSWEGEGVLSWNLEAGRLHALTLELDIEQSSYQEMSIEFGGEGHQIESSETMAGSFELTVSVE